MSNAVRTLVQDFGWIHTGIGVFGNTTFFVGSLLFLPALEPWKTVGVWLFVFGAFFMLVGAVGDLLVKIWEAEERRSGARLMSSGAQGRREDRHRG
jgi:hypothetical protein